MDVLWFSKTGVMRRDKIKNNVQFFEAIDGGYYPIHTEACYRDMDQRRPAITVFWQDVICPEGGSQTKDWVEAILRDVWMAKTNRERVHVSKLWARQLGALGKSLVVYFPLLFLMIVLMISLFEQYMPGGP